MWGPQGRRFGLTEAIFEIPPWSRDMGVSRGTLGGAKMAENFFPIFLFFFIGTVKLMSLAIEKTPITLYFIPAARIWGYPGGQLGGPKWAKFFFFDFSFFYWNG